MKKLLLTAIAAATVLGANAQKVDDTVYVGGSPSYPNHVWYSLPNDEQGTAPKNNWDIAFDASGFGSTIMINSVIGTTLWAYPKNDISGWATADTIGLYTWTPRYNDPTAWEMGAMGRYADPANPSDLDWGLYNVTTHIVSGDSLYIIKLASGDYKKLAITSLSGGIYSFKYENLDGTGLQTQTVDKSSYSAKNFAYFSLQTNAALDREPATANWDLMFGQYTDNVSGMAYTVTGVLTNKSMQIAKCDTIVGKDTMVTYNRSDVAYIHDINGIGYNWKAFTGLGYKIQDSLLYFVVRKNGDIWKMIFTGFRSSAGAMEFSKEKIYTYVAPPTTGVNNTVKSVGTALYPNPVANGRVTTLVYNMMEATAGAKVTVSDVTGKVVMTDNLENTAGLHQYGIATGTMQKGLYIVTVTTENTIAQHKLIVQ